MSDYDSWVPAESGEPADPRDVVQSGLEPDHAPVGPSPLRRFGVPLALLGGGALVGAVLAATLTAGAAPSPTPPPSSANPPGNAAPLNGDGPCPGGGHPGLRGLDQTGTVTAVAGSSVTIKTSAANTTYTVTSDSDIDKNGEAKLSDLKVGDAVRFHAATISGKPTIVVLHAGNEALNRPQHGPGDRHHFDGPRPAPSSSTSGSSTGYNA
jgi:hypothetical protein